MASNDRDPIETLFARGVTGHHLDAPDDRGEKLLVAGGAAGRPPAC